MCGHTYCVFVLLSCNEIIKFYAFFQAWRILTSNKWVKALFKKRAYTQNNKLMHKIQKHERNTTCQPQGSSVQLDVTKSNGLYTCVTVAFCEQCSALTGYFVSSCIKICRFFYIFDIFNNCSNYHRKNVNRNILLMCKSIYFIKIVTHDNYSKRYL